MTQDSESVVVPREGTPEYLAGRLRGEAFLLEDSARGHRKRIDVSTMQPVTLTFEQRVMVAAYERASKLMCEAADALAAAPSTSVREEAWHSIADAQKDGTIIWALFRNDIFPALEPERSDLAMWNGLQVPLRHPGIYSHGGREWDHGWGVAAPVGQGGFPDRWIAGWRPLPAALVSSTDEGKRHG